MLVQKPNQRHRRHEEPLRHQHRRAAAQQRGEDLLEARVHIQRRLHRKDVGFIDAQRRRDLLCIVDHRAVTPDHTLRRAGRAAREHEIRGIGVEHRGAHGLQRGAIGRFRDQRVGIERFARKAVRRKELPSGRVRDRKPRLHAVENRADPVFAHLGVDRHIETARLPDREKQRDLLCAALRKEQHRFALRAEADQRAARGVRNAFNVRERQRFVRIAERRRIGSDLRLFRQRFQHGFHINCLSCTAPSRSADTAIHQSARSSCSPCPSARSST